MTPDFFRDLEACRTRAIVGRDQDVIARLHAPEYQLITPAGRTYNLTRYLELIMAESFYAAWEHGPMEVRASAEMAVVRYLAKITLWSGKIVECWHTDIYELRASAWLAVWSQATESPKANRAQSSVVEREVVRLANAADAPCLAALATQVFLETYATSGIRLALAREAESHFSASIFVERLRNPSCSILLAERAGHLIALAEVVVDARHTLLPPGRATELTRLYVQSPFLRQGVGRRLLVRAEALAFAEGAATLWLTAWVGNNRALAFYASQGYEQLGSTEYKFEGEAFENRLFAKALSGEL